MRDHQQTIETCGQKPRPHLNATRRTMRQPFGMQDPFYEAEDRFNQKPAIPAAAITDFNRHAVIFVGAGPKPAVGQGNGLLVLPGHHIAERLIADIGLETIATQRPHRL